MLSRPTVILFGAALVAALVWLPGERESANTLRYDGPRGAPGDWYNFRRLSNSDLTLAGLQKANADFLRLRELSATRAPGLASANWSSLGPVNIGGRVLDIAVDPEFDDTLYIAAASGGIWRSTDAGDTFYQRWPSANAQAIGALAISSDATMYAGTGESGPGGGSLTYGNKGVFKSTNRGSTWSNIGLEQSERISRIVIDPNNEQRLFVAATGPLFTPGGQRGVYRSVDGGQNWQQVLAGSNTTTGASDVYIDPADPNRVYAVLWDHLRQPSLRRYGGPGSGIYRSLDGGDSWVRLAGGLPPANAEAGRIALGVAPSNGNRLYATYLDKIGFFSAFYTSLDGGNTWTQLPFDQDLSDSQSIFGWWFARLWVDPAVETRVFSAGIELLTSDNGGLNWSVDTDVHADQHALAFDPKVAGRVYLGNDGGIYRSDTNGDGGWTFASRQPFTQFYTLDVDEQDPSRLVGGTQDNRCLRSFSAQANNDWNNWGCGDGLENLINPQNQNLLYGCSQYGNCIRSLDGGETSQPIGNTVSARRNWQTPLLFDPNDPSVMYYAGDTVNRSVNGGASFVPISTDLTGGDPFVFPDDPYPFGTVTTLAVAKSDSNVIYAGTDDARIWFTRDQGANWTRVTAPNLPQRWVTKIVVRDDNADVAYATYSGFRSGDHTPYVFKTIDGGLNWTDITGDLPAAPVNTLVIAPAGTLIVATDMGVFASDNDGQSWDVFGSLPNAPVTDLRVHAPSFSLYAATFGRGVWRTLLPGTADDDGDGVANAVDNCILSPNADQRDANGDGYGNYCDADFNDDCIVSVIDLGLFRTQFFGSNPVYDLNGDGVVGTIELGLLRVYFFTRPGPSGVTDVCDGLPLFIRG